MVWYYALTDENGVLCVDQVDENVTKKGEDGMADLAESYPDVIYFGVTP